MLTCEDYQNMAGRTWDPELTLEQGLALCSLGLAGEVGEVVEPIKKHLFHGKPLDREHLARELGDVLWYVTMLCDVLDLDLCKVAQGNLQKLRARYPAGFQSGLARLPTGAM